MTKTGLKNSTLEERFKLLHMSHEKLMQSFGKILEHIGILTQRVNELGNPDSPSSINETRRH